MSDTAGTPSGAPIRVLHVDDDPEHLELASSFLEREFDELAVETATTPEEAIDRVAAADLDCVVSDYQMPERDGLELLDAVREVEPDLPFILFTGKGSEEIASEAISAGVNDYLQKEVGPDQYTILANRIRNAVDQYRTETRLRRSEERYRRLVETAPIPIVVHTNPEIVYANPAAVAFTDAASRDDLLGRSALEFVHPEERERARERVEAALDAGERPPAIEERFVSLDGHERVALVSATPVTYGGQDAVQVMLQDITERKERERDLERYERLIENLPVGVYRNTPGADGEFVDMNPALASIFEADSMAELYDLDVSDLYTDPAGREAFSRQLSEEGLVENVELEQETLAGETIWISVTAMATEEGGEVYYDGIVEDVTERKRRERELEQYETIIDAVGDPVYALDEDGRFTFVNDAFESVVGYPAEEVVGEDVSVVISEEAARAGRELIRTLLADDDRESGTYELELETADGREIPCENHLTLLPNGDGFRGTAGVLRDVSEQKRREAELEESERRFGAVFDDPGSFIGLLEPDGTLVKANDTALDFVDAAPEEVEGEPFPETPWWTHSAPLQDDLRGWIDRAAAGEFVRFEAEHRSDGETVTISGTIRPVTDDDGEVVSLIAEGRDISDRKAHERELKRYETILEALDDPVYAVDEEGRYTFVNDAHCEYTGYRPEEIIGEHVSLVLDEDDLAAARECLRTLVSSDDRTKATYELTLQRKDGGTVLCEDHLALLPTDGDGTFAGNAGVMRDITERKQRERELERYETIIQALGDPVYVLDGDGRFTFANEALEAMTGHATDELIGEEVSAVIGADERLTGNVLTWKLIADDPTRATFEVDLSTAHGEEIPCEVNVALLPVDDTPQGAAGVIRDVSERKERQETLRRQNERLEEFASVVSHDLRNPLNVAKGNLELARQEGDLDRLDRVARAHDRMDRLVGDLLWLARAGRSVGEMEPIGFPEAVRRAWASSETRDATMAIESIPDSIVADDDRLCQLLENLFHNAAEHGGTGVTVRIGATDGGFYVADDGRGIPDDEREAIFESGYSTAENGTGFGLAIVERIAEAHGWEIAATESADGGARFEITGVERSRPVTE